MKYYTLFCKNFDANKYQLKMPWLQISDLKGWECAAAPIYKIDGIPDNILIDSQGKIIDRALRGNALHTRLEQLLNM